MLCHGGQTLIKVLVIDHHGLGALQRGQLAQRGAGGGAALPGGHAAAGLAVIQAVDLGAAQTQHLHQPVGRVTQIAQVVLIHHAGPVGHHQRAAVFHVTAQLFSKILPQQVQHGSHYQPVGGGVAVLIQKIHRQPGFAQAVVMPLQFLPVAKARVARPGGILQRPLVGPVMHDGRLFGPPGAGHRRQRLQRFAHLAGLGKAASVRPAAVVDDCAVELLKAAPALPPLEVHHGIRPVGHRLQPAEQLHAGTFELAHILPVGHGGGAFHQPEGLALQRVNQVVHQRGVQRLTLIAALVPGGVVVPAGKVDFLRQIEIINVIEVVHQVGGALGLRHHRLDAVPLPFQEVDGLVAHEPPPRQIQPVVGVGSQRAGAFNLLPAGVFVAPEFVAPRLVQRFQRAVALLQPVPEGLLAQGTVALAPELVGNVPHLHRRVTAKAPGQLLVDGTYLFPVNGGGVAVVVPLAEQPALTFGGDAQHLRVLLRQPVGACAAGRGKVHADARGPQAVDDVRQPVQLIVALRRLQRGPGEHAHRNHVHVGGLHQFNVTFEDIGAVQPLLGVVVAAVVQGGAHENLLIK